MIDQVKQQRRRNVVRQITDDAQIIPQIAEIKFKRPANKDLYASFVFENDELDDIKRRVAQNNEIEIVK